MKVTRIVQQLKQASRYSIYIDGKYEFSLSESALLESGLSNGQAVTPKQLADYKQQSVNDKLYQRTLRYVALRPRTTWEVEQYLGRHTSPAPLIEQITNKLHELRLLDDTAYATAFIHDRQTLRPTSRRKMMLELRKKHVTEEIIREVLEREEANDTTALQAIIVSKRRQTKYQDNLRLMQYLARQGFSYDEIKNALHEESSDLG